VRGGVSLNGLALTESGGESLGFVPPPPPGLLLDFALSLHGLHLLGIPNPFSARNFFSPAGTTKLAPHPRSEHRIR